MEEDKRNPMTKMKPVQKKLTKKQKAFVATLVALFAIGGAVNSYALTASTTAKAKMKVLALFKITTIKDLIFPDAYPGAASESVAAGTANAAEFKVEGPGTAAFTVTLPTSVTMDKIGGTGLASEKIEVTSFVSSLPSNAGALVGGVKNFTVGATRAALASNQADGDYEGTFQVDVVY